MRRHGKTSACAPSMTELSNNQESKELQPGQLELLSTLTRHANSTKRYKRNNRPQLFPNSEIPAVPGYGSSELLGNNLALSCRKIVIHYSATPPGKLTPLRAWAAQRRDVAFSNPTPFGSAISDVLHVPWRTSAAPSLSAHAEARRRMHAHAPSAAGVCKTNSAATPSMTVGLSPGVRELLTRRAQRQRVAVGPAP